MPTIKLYELSRGASRFVKWVGPDGKAHYIDVLNPPTGNLWAITNDSAGKPVMAYKPGFHPGEDGELVVSLEGALSIVATLMHNEDDFPRKYYFATDSKNNNPLDRPAFILRCEGLRQSPVEKWASLRVMVVVP